MPRTTRTAQPEQTPIDLDLVRTEWRLLGAVERYKAVCTAAGRRPTSLGTWLVFLAELAKGDELRLDTSPSVRPALGPVPIAA